jgi:hypothetical protein
MRFMGWEIRYIGNKMNISVSYVNRKIGKGKGEFYPRTGHKTPEEFQRLSHCIGGCVGSRTSLDGCGTICLYQDAILRLSRPMLLY